MFLQGLGCDLEHGYIYQQDQNYDRDNGDVRDMNFHDTGTLETVAYGAAAQVDVAMVLFIIMVRPLTGAVRTLADMYYTHC